MERPAQTGSAWSEDALEELRRRLLASIDRAAELAARIRAEVEYWERGGVPPEPGPDKGPAP